MAHGAARNAREKSMLRISNRIRQSFAALAAGGILAAAPTIVSAAAYDLLFPTADPATQWTLGLRTLQESPQSAPRLGLGRYGLGFSGSAEAWPSSHDQWIRRAMADEAGSAVVSLAPGIAYRPSSRLSVGAGLELRYRSAPDSPAGLPASLDGRLGTTGLAGAGVNLGVRYAFDPRTEVGLAYRSQLSQDSFWPRYSVARIGDLDSGALMLPGIAVPQALSASIQRQFGSRWSLSGSLGWQEWAQADVDPLAGRVTATSRGGDAWFAGVGAQYRLRHNLDLGMSAEYLRGSGLDAARRSLTRSDFPGGDGYYFFGLDLNWRF